MAVRIESRDEIKKEMWNRLEKCIRRLQEVEDTLLKDERTRHCHAEAKERIRVAQKLVAAFRYATEEAEEEKRVNETLENAEQYLGMLRELIPMLQEIDNKEREFGEKIGKALTRKDDESGDEWVHILHLSDLHFGIYIGTGDDEQDKDDFFEVVEDQMFSFFDNYIKKGNRIDIVAVTGDISFQNKKAGYDDFKNWLEKLCGKDLLNIDIKNHVIICPGNHDSSYKYRNRNGLISEKSEESTVGEVLTVDKIRSRQNQFHFFNDICQKLKIEPLTNFDSHTSKCTVPYVMGFKKIEGIHFVVLNSAWNSFPHNEKNGSDHGQLLLGRRPTKTLLKEAQIPKGEMTVMLFHHPLSWLHEAEIRTYRKDQGAPTAVLIRQNADVILNGHVHGGIEPPDILANKTVVFGGGTLYTKDNHLNQFEIISVNMTRHYCIQKVVCYNTLNIQGHSLGWEITGEKCPTQIHYGVYRDIRDLVAKYSLGEITMQEAEQRAIEQLADIGIKAFWELFERSRDRKIKDIVEKDIYLPKVTSDTLEESAGKTKTMTKDGGEGEKQS